jgi:hypothetical protein
MVRFRQPEPAYKLRNKRLEENEAMHAEDATLWKKELLVKEKPVC